MFTAADPPALGSYRWGGDRKTLRLVAQYGDACNLFGTSPKDVAHKLDVLRRHCDAVGRDYDQIRKTIQPVNARPTPRPSNSVCSSPE